MIDEIRKEKMQKFDALLVYLKQMGSAVLAFSGGVDSSLLLAAGAKALGKDFTAVTIDTPYIPRREIAEAKELAATMGVTHEVIRVDIPEEILKNPKNRCYLCKLSLFSHITAYAEKIGCPIVIEGTNADDVNGYRPGLWALEELDIRSPLKECGIDKQDIRDISYLLGLPIWNKPAYACLLTRLPYQTDISLDKLAKIEKAEDIMFERGFRAVRVRCHDKLARIELPVEDIAMLADDALRTYIVENIKAVGFDFVTVDMAGYKTGSFDSQLNIDSKDMDIKG